MAGANMDTLVLRVSQDAFTGADALFRVYVDGVQVGGNYAASALRKAGQFDTLTLTGNWGSGAHDVEIRYLNDFRNVITGENRNLYVESVQLNGQLLTGGNAALLTNGATTFSTGPDQLVVKVSQDAMAGADAQFQIFVDGFQIGGNFSTSALRNAWQSDTLTFAGDWGAGPHDVQVKFLNDGYNGATGADRNLFVESVAFNGQYLTGGTAALFYTGSTTSFKTGSDTLVVKVSQAAMAGADAQFQVFVDGVQQGGNYSVSALRKAGKADALTFTGDWGLGKHDVQIRFVNDAQNTRTGEDRNLFVESVALNGNILTGDGPNLYKNGGATFSTGADTLVLKVSQSAMAGADTLFRVYVDGVQVGGNFSTAALRKAGQSDTLSFTGDWGTGAHKVEVQFLNDARNLLTGEDRNLYIEGATYNGVAILSAKQPIYSGTGKFDIPVTKAPGFYDALGNLMPESGATQNWTINGGAGAQRTGSSANDLFYSAWDDRLVGGLGDDIYQMWDPLSLVVEKAGEGVDTMVGNFWGGVTLAANVENLILKAGGATFGTGNALANLIIAGDVGATLNGLGGNDVLVGGKGADIFRITAGNGTDAIVNFQHGWDIVSLEGYGIDSFAKLLSRATQVGGDVSIRLSASESVLLRDVGLSTLSATDFNLPMTPIAPEAGKIWTDKAGAAWNYNGWYVHNNAWGAGNLQWGTDVQSVIQFNRADMTAGAQFSWSVPITTDLYRQVILYPEVIFGVSPWDGSGKNPTDKANVFPIKVADLVGFTVDQDLDLSGSLSGFNVAYDLWLTSKPGGDSSAITNEIMVWVHKGAFDPWGEKVGSYTSADGYTAQVWHSGTYTAVVFDKDRPEADLDFAHLLNALGQMNIVSSNEYLAAIELGAEVVSGKGGYTINDLDFTLTSRNANGSLTTKFVTGAGTTVTTTSATAAHAADMLGDAAHAPVMDTLLYGAAQVHEMLLM